MSKTDEIIISCSNAEHDKQMRHNVRIRLQLKQYIVYDFSNVKSYNLQL